MKTLMELVNRGTLVGLMDGFWSAHLSNGISFTWNVGRTIGLPSGGGKAAFSARGMHLEDGNRGVQKCDSVDP